MKKIIIVFVYQLYRYLKFFFKRVSIRLDNIYYKEVMLKNEGRIVKPHYICGEDKISIGKNSVIAEGSILTVHNTNISPSPILNIGEECRIGEHCHISVCDEVSIGKNVLTGCYVYISDNSHGSTSNSDLQTPPDERELTSKGKVIIGDNVWIGDKCSILSGVTIGSGCIVAANAVVTHSFPSNCILGGVPARIIKQL